MRIVFHVGMGKTGSTTIQSALSANADALAQAGHRYLGPWLGVVRPEFDGFAGFQTFLRLPPDQLAAAALALLGAIERERAAGGTRVWIVSNEQYLENIPKLSGFFRIIADRADLRVIIFVRPPGQWLPSAYIQWGVVHKTNPGPVRPFAVKARELMRQYGYIRIWRDLLGDAVIVRPFDGGGDVVRDFLDLLGLSLPHQPARQQVRPAVAETLLRAACNSALPGMVLPDVFDAIRASHSPPGTPVRLSERFAQIFNQDAIEAIIAENRETLSYIERECGIDMHGPVPAPPQFDLEGLTDELLGTLLGLVYRQAHEIRDLRARLERLERQQDRT